LIASLYGLRCGDEAQQMRLIALLVGTLTVVVLVLPLHP